MRAVLFTWPGHSARNYLAPAAPRLNRLKLAVVFFRIGTEI
ncbi:MAG: hypothetical protein QOH41_275 [Blastocatellia bacterium]|jgi:hypothetical protein|nr:hypothetical protein [Blastocatellia bacterium]